MDNTKPKRNQLIFYCLMLIINVITVEAFVLTDCSKDVTSPDAKLGQVTIDKCSEDDERCPLVIGSNSTIKVEFDTVKGFKEAKLDVAGKIGIWIPFSIQPDDACGNYGFNCPVNQNEKKELVISLPIKKIYPKTNVDIRVKLLDENKNLIVCFIIPAQIVDAN